MGLGACAYFGRGRLFGAIFSGDSRDSFVFELFLKLFEPVFRCQDRAFSVISALFSPLPAVGSLDY